MARPRAIVPVAKEAHVRALIFGEPGVGKSRLAGTSEKALVLANNPDETVSMLGSDASMWPVEDISEATEALEYLRHEGHKEFDWAWLDNGTLFQEQNMDSIMENLVAEKPTRDRFVPDRPEYLRNQNQLSLFMRNFTRLPMNVGVTTHVMRYYDEEDDKTFLIPMFQGGRGEFSQKICGYMNIVGYMGARKVRDKGTERYLITTKAGKYWAKDRFHALPERMVDPTIPKMVELIETAKKSRSSGGSGSARRRSTGSTKKKTTRTRS